MLDNLQHHYLAQLERAQTAALDGDLDTCLDVCFELRLRPNLALCTRAMVNLTLADTCPVETHPDKVKFAEEAVRLAEELKVEETPAKDADWAKRLEELAVDGKECLQRTKDEVKQYQDSIQEARQGQADVEESGPAEKESNSGVEQKDLEGVGGSALREGSRGSPDVEIAEED